MQSTLTFLLVLAVVLGLCLTLSANDRRRAEAQLRRSLLASFGQIPRETVSAQRYERIPAWYLRHLPEDGMDDITWNDLDMDQIYARINCTRSGAGEEFLYALLRSPIRRDPEGGIPLCEIRWFESEEHAKTRTDLQIALTRFGHAGRYSIYEYLDILDEAKTESNLRHLPAFLLPLASIALLFVSVPAGVLCLIGSLILNMITYYRRRGEIEPYIVSFAWLLRMLRCADDILDLRCEAISAEGEELRSLRPSFARFCRGSGILLSGSAVSGGSVFDFVIDYIRILFHLDLIKFNTMLSEAGRLLPEIDRVLTLLGRIDTAICLASFEKSLPYTCAPVLHDLPGAVSAPETAAGGPTGPAMETGGEGLRKASGGASDPASSAVCFCAKGLYHPLLDQPVANDVSMRRPILLTGSNASGKSTFLKAAALCALLAQTVGFCPAQYYEGAVFRIRSSMALRDSIRNGESYFMVEIRSLKRIADLTGDGGRPVLCCIDEVLRGTNTIERIAASTEILKTLAGRGVLALAATHDIELASLLQDHFDNYHFEEELAGGDVVFSYRLHPGRATTRNAIRLLDAVGFDEEITRRARRRAEHFEETGRWEEAGRQVPSGT